MVTIKSICTKNDCYKAGKSIRVKGIMLHSIGTPQPNAKIIADFWNNPQPGGREVCCHAVIDTEKVFQCLPWAMRGWHGGGAVNNTHIGVEMTEPSTIKYKGGATYDDLNPQKTKEHVLGTYKTAVELFAVICKEYKLNPLEQGVIISHSEGYKLGIASNHADVEHLWNKFGLTMDSFRKTVYEKMNEKNELTDVNEIISKLQKIGIITNAELWNEKLNTDINSYWLARKFVNYIK